MDTKATILIVDDDPKFRKILSDILRDKGYVPLAAVKGKTALDRVKEGRPVVALIDLKLSDMDGLEVMREIKKCSPGTECIVLTGYASQKSAVEAVNMGAYGYMQKPYDVEQLVVTIRRAIEKREAEEALRKSEEKYRQLIENAQEGIWAIDVEAKTTFVNERVAEILGYSVDEMLGSSLFSFMDEGGVALAKYYFERRKQGIKERHDFEFLRKDGTRVYTSLEASPIMDDGGDFVGVLAFVADITERKKAEEALRESEEQYRDLYEEAPIAYLSVGVDGRILRANRGAVELLGYGMDELVGRAVFDLYADTPTGKAKAQKLFLRFRAGAEIRGEELEMRRADGRLVWISLSVRPIRDTKGQVVGSRSMVVDITERKRAEEPHKRATLETLEALSQLVEASDPYTSGHSARVTEMAIKIAQEMGLRNRHLDTLRIAGPLHDVGKVGIPSSVLNKPAGLTQAEWVMVQAHPEVSAKVAQQVTAFEAAVPVIRHHHERWDGTGYPEGLKGEDIPLLARILAVADGFEAMISERPYRRARTEEEALAELEKGAGTQWDPEVVKAFLRVRKRPAKGKGRRVVSSPW